MSKQRLNAFMGWSKGMREEGACLVFAQNHAEAKTQTYRCLTGWFDDQLWIDVRVGKFRGEALTQMYTQADQHKLTHGIAHYVESPESCTTCGFWGMPLNGGGRCKSCETDADVKADR